MTVISTDIQARLSGGVNNANPATSLGGVMSSVQTPLKLFDDISNTEAINGRIEYRLIYIYNNRPTTLRGTTIWLEDNTNGATTEAELGKGNSGMNGTEPAIATEGAVPAGINFTVADSSATGLLLGDIPSNQKFPVWIRWSVNPGSAVVESDPITFRIDGSYEE